jgi:hypothetical protein
MFLFYQVGKKAKKFRQLKIIVLQKDKTLPTPYYKLKLFRIDYQL